MLNQSTLQFRTTCPDTPIFAFVDAQKIRRVFDNLIENSLKYALDHTNVSLSIQVIENKAIVTLFYKLVRSYFFLHFILIKCFVEMIK